MSTGVYGTLRVRNESELKRAEDEGGSSCEARRGEASKSTSRFPPDPFLPLVPSVPRTTGHLPTVPRFYMTLQHPAPPVCGAYGSSPLPKGPQTEGTNVSLVVLQYRIRLSDHTPNHISSLKGRDAEEKEGEGGDGPRRGFGDADSRSFEVFPQALVVLRQPPELQLRHRLPVRSQHVAAQQQQQHRRAEQGRKA